MIRSRNSVVALALGGLALSIAAPALAENPRVNVQVFRPATHHDDLLTTMNTNIGRHLRWSGGLLVNYGKNPLVLVDSGSGTEMRRELIQDQLTLDLMGSISLFDRVSVGLALPLFLVNDGDFVAPGVDTIDTEPSSFAIGDVRLSPKVGILMREEGGDGLGLAAELELNLPTGDADSLVSDGFLLTPTIIADYQAGPFLAAVNIGYRVRFDDQELPFDTQVGNELTWRVGGRYDVVPDLLQAIGEVYGASADYTSSNNTHVEGVLAGRLLLIERALQITVGGGSGFTTGYGNTKFRVFAGVRYSPQVIVDQDEDGILDDVDKCPLQPEDKDGFQDEDGCPEPDNDGDGIADTKDSCPNDKEDKDDFQDEDGCPDPDNDGDGLADGADKCPNEAEDADGWEDDDGCPDVDNDNDGILDLDDRCPNEAEVRNGVDDEDGCPDESLAVLTADRIVIKDKIYFDTRKAVIKEESLPVMRAVAGILKANPHIKGVRIEGHTDDRGGDNYNKKLSQARADSVMAWLINDGVEAERLISVGFGEEQPAQEGKTDEAREANRRVEFIITAQ